jgi:hypothetical protein|nr:MAG TPA: hypothetical protein [Bacteriophage sp.]
MNGTFSNAVMVGTINSFRNTLYIAIKFMLDKELYDIYNKDLYCNCGDFVYSKFIGFNKMTITLKDFSMYDNKMFYSDGEITIDSGEGSKLDIRFNPNGWCDAYTYGYDGMSYVVNAYERVIEFIKQYIDWYKFDRGFLIDRLREFVTQYGLILQLTNMR